jgi:hypothetical protein
MLDVTEIYRPDTRDFELQPFQDRVLELVRLFERESVVRLRVAGAIAAGEPIEAIAEPEAVELRGPAESPRCHRTLHGLRRYLCPALESVSGDAFEVARIITPLLAGLRVAGKLPIDLDPWLFAGVSLLIARMGVAAFCADEEGDEGMDGGTADAAGAPTARSGSASHGRVDNRTAPRHEQQGKQAHRHKDGHGRHRGRSGRGADG